MSEQNNTEFNFTQKLLRFSEVLDPNLETTSISENRYEVKIFFKKTKKLCFFFEYEIDKNRNISIYNNIIIEGDYDPHLKKCYLLELFFATPLKFDIRTIKIQSFPITKNELNIYLEGYNRSYHKRLIPQNEVFSSDNTSLQSGVYQYSIVRKNHFIPQGYLRKFEYENYPGFIFNFTINGADLNESSGTAPVKIENIMYYTHFYSLGMELLLQEIEDKFFQIRDRIIQEGNMNWIGDKEKFLIVRYLFAQHIRTPLERDRFIALSVDALKKVYFNRKDGIDDIEGLKIEFDELFTRLKFEENIYNFLHPPSDKPEGVDLFNFYMRNNWKLISAEHMKFYTSDNPIVLYNDRQRSDINQTSINALKGSNIKIIRTKRIYGLGEPGIQLYFPISPKFCILIYNPQSNQRLLTPVEINKKILFQCYENILSSKNNIRNFLRRNLNNYRSEREKFIKLHINVSLEEI